MRSGLLRVITALALAFMLSVAAVTAGALTSSNADTRGVILFAGDSNITLATQKIDWALTWTDHRDNGYVPVFASRVGASIRTSDCLDPTNCTTVNYWETKLGSIEGKVTPDAIVTELGINDASSPGTETTPGYAKYGEKIDWFMNLLHGRQVLWTNLPCTIEPPSFVIGCKHINYALSRAPTRWSNLTILNWNVASANHTEYMTAGDVHYTSAGYTAWTNFVVQALDARFPSP